MNEYDACLIECHTQVKDSGNLNFLECRIPAKFQLNTEEWQMHLQVYWDEQLLHLLRFCFPLDFNGTGTLPHENRNHTYALEYPQQLWRHIWWKKMKMVPPYGHLEIIPLLIRCP